MEIAPFLLRVHILNLMDSFKLTRTRHSKQKTDPPVCRKEDFHCLNESWDEFLSILVAIGAKNSQEGTHSQFKE